jgi:hypothetical protein
MKIIEAISLGVYMVVGSLVINGLHHRVERLEYQNRILIKAALFELDGPVDQLHRSPRNDQVTLDL